MNAAIVLVSPRNPLNIGAVARAMSNFGFFDLRLVNAYGVAFEEARSAVHAEGVLRDARQYSTLSDALADCTLVAGATGTADRDLKTPVYRLEQATRDLVDAGSSGRLALVFGSEKFGLSREDISHCHQTIHIPTRPVHDSMNLGQAVAVCLYELVREPDAALTARKVSRRAPVRTIDRLHQVFFRVLKQSGYVKPRIAVSTGEKLRQLLMRMNLSTRDATLLLGMVRQLGLALQNEEIRAKACAHWPAEPLD